MKVGLQLIFQNYRHEVSDEQMVAEELRVAELGEALGFDDLWPVEHHFRDYAACPDNTQVLSYLAAKTSTIRLATGAVILPWNDPLRVAEKVILLDHLSGGRAVFGMGRGLARCEYAGFGIDMEESRDRFDEAAPMILEALETGVIEGAGPYYPQARTELRPGPRGSFRGRTYCVAMSPDSVLQAAKLGAAMVVFSNQPNETILQSVETYRAEYARHHTGPPPPPRFCDFMVCAEDAAVARDLADRHIAGYFLSVMSHYELLGDHFKDSRAYRAYGEATEALRAANAEDVAKAYIACQAFGTPEHIVRRLEHRRDVVGDFELSICVKFAGLTLDQTVRSMELFAREVLPALHAWTPAAVG